MKVYGGSRGITTGILNLGTRCRWRVHVRNETDPQNRFIKVYAGNRNPIPRSSKRRTVIPILVYRISHRSSCLNPLQKLSSYLPKKRTLTTVQILLLQAWKRERGESWRDVLRNATFRGGNKYFFSGFEGSQVVPALLSAKRTFERG
jgi:hypothetical protein